MPTHRHNVIVPLDDGGIETFPLEESPNLVARMEERSARRSSGDLTSIGDVFCGLISACCAAASARLTAIL